MDVQGHAASAEAGRAFDGVVEGCLAHRAGTPGRPEAALACPP
jgi:hypothetical protein